MILEAVSNIGIIDNDIHVVTCAHCEGIAAFLSN